MSILRTSRLVESGTDMNTSTLIYSIVYSLLREHPVRLDIPKDAVVDIEGRDQAVQP